MDGLNIPYCGPAPPPQALHAAFNPDPWVILGLLLLGVAALWRQRRAGTRQGAALALGLAALAVAFLSPLCALTVALFSARAAHHLLLVSVAAPALALALPLRGMGAGPACAALAAALAAWHLPALYTAAWNSHVLYWIMQGVLILPAWAFWSAVFHRAGKEPGALLAGGLLVAGLAGGMGLLGAILTFAPRALYAEHLPGSALYGLDPLQDQQLAGLLMWVPGFLPLALVALLMFRRAWQRGALA